MVKTINAPEAAELLGLQLDTLYSYVRRGKIPHVQVPEHARKAGKQLGRPRLYAFDPSELRRLCLQPVGNPNWRRTEAVTRIAVRSTVREGSAWASAAKRGGHKTTGLWVASLADRNAGRGTAPRHPDERACVMHQVPASAVQQVEWMRKSGAKEQPLATWLRSLANDATR